MCLAVRSVEVWLRIPPNPLSRDYRCIILAFLCPAFFQTPPPFWPDLRARPQAARPPPGLSTPCCHSPLATLLLPESSLRPPQAPWLVPPLPHSSQGPFPLFQNLPSKEIFQISYKAVRYSLLRSMGNLDIPKLQRWNKTINLCPGLQYLQSTECPSSLPA